MSTTNMGSLIKQPRVAWLVGEFIARWSILEAMLMMPLLFAMKSQDDVVAGAILSSVNSTQAKVSVVKNAVKTMSCNAEQEVRKSSILAALKEIEPLCQKRDQICHHTWGIDNVTGGVVRVNFRVPLGQEGRILPISEQELRELCDETLDLAGRICSASGATWFNEDAARTLRLSTTPSDAG